MSDISKNNISDLPAAERSRVPCEDHVVGVLTDENATRVTASPLTPHDPATCWHCLNGIAAISDPPRSSAAESADTLRERTRCIGLIASASFHGDQEEKREQDIDDLIAKIRSGK